MKNIVRLIPVMAILLSLSLLNTQAQIRQHPHPIVRNPPNWRRVGSPPSRYRGDTGGSGNFEEIPSIRTHESPPVTILLVFAGCGPHSFFALAPVSSAATGEAILR